MCDTRNVSIEQEWGNGRSFWEVSFNGLQVHFTTEAETKWKIYRCKYEMKMMMMMKKKQNFNDLYSGTFKDCEEQKLNGMLLKF